MTERGRFIVVEGMEGAGKTTAIKTLHDALHEQGVKEIILTREPGGTPIGESLRSLIKHELTGEKLSDLTELLLIYASRVQLTQTLIQPALERGAWVIADRFELSTYAYQGGGRGLNFLTIDNLSRLCLNGFQPDLLFFLDISPELGLERAKLRGEMDRIESESLAFFQRVHAAYQSRIKESKNVICIDAGQPLPKVQADIISSLDEAKRNQDLFINEDEP